MISIHRRRGGHLAVERARHRTSAFVYGNITVLGALLTVDPHGVETGFGAVSVAATAVATFVAHIMADLVSDRVQPRGSLRKPRDEILEELRDATPIATSGALPIVFLLSGTLGFLPVQTALWMGVAVVIGRLALTGLVIERLSERQASPAALWGGIVLSVSSAVLAVGKAVLTH